MKGYLLLGLFLGACTLPSAIGQEAEADIRAQVCSVWLEVSYDGKLDTPQTVKEVRANNRARNEYCKGAK